MSAPTGLRVEHLDAPIGISERQPRLSWLLPLTSSRQIAFELDGEVLPPVDSDRSVLVPWPGSPLPSRQRVTWRVQVWTDRGVSYWPAPAGFETGLLDPTDWNARWIEPHEPERAPSGRRPGYVLRHQFDMAEGGPARLYATTAEVVLPDGHALDAAPGTSSHRCTLGTRR